MIAILNSISRVIFASLANTTLQVTLLISLIALIIWLLRIRSPATRYSLWLFAMFGVIALPLITSFIPQIEVPLPRRPETTIHVPQEPELLKLERQDSGGSDESSLPASSATTENTAANDASVTDASMKREPNTSPINPISLVFLIWLVGALATLFIVLDAYTRLRNLKTRAPDVEDQTALEILDRLKQELKIGRSVALRACPEIHSPISFGVFSHTIILPYGVIDDRDVLEMVLTHELAHIKRWDYLVNLLQNVLKVFFFFHPLFHLTSRQLAREREHICDDWVIQVSKQRSRYAECILGLLERASYRPVRALVITGIAQRKRDIPKRIDMITDRTRNISTRCSGQALVMIFIIGCFALLAIGSVVLIRRPTSHEVASTDDTFTPEMQKFLFGDNRPDPEVEKLLYQAVKEFNEYRKIGWGVAKQKALQLVEEALTKAERLPSERARKVARMQALFLRTLYLDYPERKNVDQLHGEILALALELGDRSMQAQMLSSLVFSSEYTVGRMNRTEMLENKVKLLDDAASLYQSAGKKSEEGHTLLLKADFLMREGGQYAEARPIIAQAKKLFTELKSHSQEIACDAAIEFIEHLPRTDNALMDSLDAWYWGCTVFRVEDGKLIHYAGGPFGGDGGRLHVLPFYQIANVTDEPLVDPSKRPGDTWTKDTFSFGYHPLRTTVTVMGDDETVTVPAGTFANCRLIRMETRDTDETKAEEERIRQTNEALMGIREVWYAPGVGIVRLRLEREKESHWESFALALRDYNVLQETQDYLPLAIGNRWVYEREDLDKQEYVSERVLQVRRRDEHGMFYLSHYGYVYH